MRRSSSIAQSALVKSVNLFKMASADPFTTVAFLRTMADVDPEPPDRAVDVGDLLARR